MTMIIRNASFDGWATVGIKIISIALNRQAGANPVTMYTAAAAPDSGFAGSTPGTQPTDRQPERTVNGR